MEKRLSPTGTESWGLEALAIHLSMAGSVRTTVLKVPSYIRKRLSRFAESCCIQHNRRSSLWLGYEDA